MSTASQPSATERWTNDAGSSSSAAGGVNPAIIQLVLLVAIPFCLQSTEGERLLSALIITTGLLAILSMSAASGIFATLFYLIAMGHIRRLLISVFGYSGNDPFIAVPAILSAYYFANLLIRRAIPRDTPLSKAVGIFLIVMVLGVFNPLQGGLLVGLAGALLYIGPVLWFYIGRLHVTPAVMRTLSFLFLAMSVFVALYGWKQQFLGLFQFETDYIGYSHYNQILSGSTSRVFSTLNGFAEYAHVLAIGTVISFALVLRRNRLAVATFVLLFVAVLLTSSRGVVINAVTGCMIVWAVQGRSTRSWLPRVVLAIVLGSVGTLWSLRGLQSTAITQNKSASELLGHTEEGLSDPLGKKSTGAGHLSMTFRGVGEGFTRPFGLGTGSTTLAASKFGGEANGGASTEGDLGNSFVTWGFFGGFLYLYLFCRTLFDAAHNWNAMRDDSSLIALGILTGLIGTWLNGGEYVIVFVIWLTIGFVDRQTRIRLQMESQRRRSAT